MTTKLVDARNLPCPLPVVRTKEALAAMSEGTLSVMVSDLEQVDNLETLVRSLGHQLAGVSVKDEAYHVTIEVTPGAEEDEPPTVDESVFLCSRSKIKTPVIFIGKETIGGGSDELGGLLMRSFCATLDSVDGPPGTILLMNGGVKLATEGAPTVPALTALVDKGVTLLVCGTCLDYYGLKGSLAVGAISNMYDITQAMLDASHVVSL